MGLLRKLRTKIFSRKRYIVIAVIILVVAGMIGLSRTRPDFEVETTTVERGDLIEAITASGDVQANSSVDLNFQSSARLNWVGVKEGDAVTRGQAIASLDKRDLEKNLKKYLNLYVKERQDFDQTQEDNEDWPELADEARRETLRILEKAQQDLNNTVLEVEIQHLAVELATLTTPISGIVTKVTTPVAGVNVTPTTSTFSIVDPETVYFEAEVSEFDVPKVKAGQSVNLFLDAYPDETLESSVESLNFTSTTTSTGGTAYIARVSLPANDAARFKIGMNGEAEIILDTKEGVLLVPLTAVTEEDEKEYVWTVEDGRAKRLEVETGTSSINNIEITEGLEEGQEIITRPPAEISEGAKVKIS